MKRKKVIALLLTASIMATMPAYTLASPMIVCASEMETVENNKSGDTKDTLGSDKHMELNEGTIQHNYGDVDKNTGIIKESGPFNGSETGGTIGSNEGHVDANFGDINENKGIGVNEKSETGNGVKNNYGQINVNTGEVKTNVGSGIIAEFETKKENNPDKSNDEIYRMDGYTGNGIKNNKGTVDKNAGDILATENGSSVNTNTGTIYFNHGTVNENNGTINAVEKDGAVINNTGTINNNHGSVDKNTGRINLVEKVIGPDEHTGKVNENGGVIDNNHGEINENKFYLNNNKGIVTTNSEGAKIMVNGDNGVNSPEVTNNAGYIEQNFGVVKNNTGTVGWNSAGGQVTGEGYVSVNCGTVTTDSLSKIGTNLDTVIIIDDGTYYAIAFDNQKKGEENFFGNLANVKENTDYEVNLISGVGLRGDIFLKAEDKDKVGNLKDLGIEEVDGKYIIPLGTKLKVNGVINLYGEWYRIVASNDEETVVEKIDEPEEEIIVEAPKMKSESVAGVEIKEWSDVSKVLTTMAEKIVANPETNVKTFSLDLTESSKAIPVDVVTSLSASTVDELSCTIAENTAISFKNDESLANYLPTDFSLTQVEGNTMKTLNFYTPQDIGIEVTMSTTVPAKNAMVAVWQLTDGVYNLLTVVMSGDDGSVSFPISTTGNIALTY